jgi:hypothetical protein
MAVIIREEKIIEDKIYKVEVYRTSPGKLITDEEKKKAEKLDRILSERVKEIEKEMKDSGLINLKRKRGKVHKLWYEVGKKLEFIMNTSIVAAEDRKFVWRAIYDHVDELAPGPLSERVKRNPEASHFSYCYKLSRFPWEFVEMAGDWTSWSEFFDRKETMNDPRIIEWLGLKAEKSNVSGRQNWLRPLTKAIHKEFNKRDTTFLSLEELQEILDRIFFNISENEKK